MKDAAIQRSRQQQMSFFRIYDKCVNGRRMLPQELFNKSHAAIAGSQLYEFRRTAKQPGFAPENLNPSR
jgi:hypothetical protein